MFNKWVQLWFCSFWWLATKWVLVEILNPSTKLYSWDFSLFYFFYSFLYKCNSSFQIFQVSIWDIRCNKAINCLYDHTNIVMETAFLTSSLLFTVGDTKCCVWNTFDPHGKSICSLQQHSWSCEVLVDWYTIHLEKKVSPC